MFLAGGRAVKHEHAPRICGHEPATAGNSWIPRIPCLLLVSCKNSSRSMDMSSLPVFGLASAGPTTAPVTALAFALALGTSGSARPIGPFA